MNEIPTTVKNLHQSHDLPFAVIPMFHGIKLLNCCGESVCYKNPTCAGHNNTEKHWQMSIPQV